MEASQVTNIVSGTAGLLLTGVSSSMTKGMELINNVSSGVGEAAHNINFGLQRMMTSPNDGETFIGGIDIESPSSSRQVGLSSDSDRSSMSEGRIESSAAVDVELGIDEKSFSNFESDVGSQECLNQLSSAIEKCKNLMLNSEESSERRRTLVHKLIQLRICLEQAKEDAELADIGIKVQKNHRMEAVLYSSYYSKRNHCDQCTHIIWGVIHIMYKCSICGFQCHRRCLKQIRRSCASVLFNERPNYIYKVCPEVGLSAQEFACAECGKLLNFSNPWAEARLCDYSGLFFCPACHWNNVAVIPARAVHNWDFSPYPVSQRSLQLLHYMNKKTLIHLEELNVNLFYFIADISKVKKKRGSLVKMREYLQTCRVAQESRMLKLNDEYQHLLEEENCYSLQDLHDLHKGTLLPFLSTIHNDYINHIKNTCQICKGKGFFCEKCSGEDLIFPFDENVSTCSTCKAAYHVHCFQQDSCPRCDRHQKRRLSSFTSTSE